MDETIYEYKSGGAIERSEHSWGRAITFDTLDLTGDYFSAETNLGFLGEKTRRVPVLFHHGMALKDERGRTYQDKRPIGEATLRLDDDGVSVDDLVLYNAKKYERSLARMGFSTGAPANAVIREPTEAGNHIKQWFPAELSLTPTPAEPRNMVTVKSADLPDDADDVETLESIAVLAAISAAAALSIIGR